MLAKEKNIKCRGCSKKSSMPRAPSAVATKKTCKIHFAEGMRFGWDGVTFFAAVHTVLCPGSGT